MKKATFCWRDFSRPMIIYLSAIFVLLVFREIFPTWKKAPYFWFTGIIAFLIFPCSLIFGMRPFRWASLWLIPTVIVTFAGSIYLQIEFGSSGNSDLLKLWGFSTVLTVSAPVALLHFCYPMAYPVQTGLVTYISYLIGYWIFDSFESLPVFGDLALLILLFNTCLMVPLAVGLAFRNLPDGGDTPA